MSVYSFGVLSLVNNGEANEANDTLLGPTTLGIEVTDSSLAARCGLGNLDPQHGLCLGSGMAAIEGALTLDPLPSPGAILVTLRADADALGAMAVLALRANCRTFNEASCRRIAEIARLDRHDRGSWHRWAENHPPLSKPARLQDLSDAGMPAQTMALIARDDAMSLNDRVFAIADWLASGRIPKRIGDRAKMRLHRLVNAWNDGSISVAYGPVAWLAVVQSPMPAGLQFGYRLAPVVIAETKLVSGRKLTIAQFETGWFDRNAILKVLDMREPGWGGQANIIGSPQGRSSKITLRDVVELVTCNGGELASEII